MNRNIDHVCRRRCSKFRVFNFTNFPFVVVNHIHSYNLAKFDEKNILEYFESNDERERREKLELLLKLLFLLSSLNSLTLLKNKLMIYREISTNRRKEAALIFNNQH